MKIRSDIILTKVAGEYLAVPTGSGAERDRVIIRLNETGHFIWQGVADGKSAEAIAAAITEEYAIDYAAALAKTNGFLAKMTEAGILEN